MVKKVVIGVGAALVLVYVLLLVVPIDPVERRPGRVSAAIWRRTKRRNGPTVAASRSRCKRGPGTSCRTR